MVVGASESSFTVSETGPAEKIGAAVVVTSQESVLVPSVVTAPSTQPVFVNAEAPKPCQVTVGALVYQPFDPFGLAGETCAQTKPVPFRPGPVIVGLLVVFAPPAGKAVSNHCGKNWSSRALHDALGVGSQSRKACSSCGSVMLPPP